jgi:hypothetical protein
MRGIKLTIVLKQNFPVGAIAPLPPPCGRTWGQVSKTTFQNNKPEQ